MRNVIIPASTIAVLQQTLDALESKAARGGVPPKGAQTAAARGLELREQYGRGGTMIGVARARDIKNGRNLSERTVRRMKAYFDRHEVDKQGKDWGNPDRPSNGYIAWLLWGGDPGRTWATKMVERWNREDGKTKTLPRWLPNGDEITELKQLAAVLCIDEKTAAYVVLDSSNPPLELLVKAQRFVRTRAGAIHYGQPIGTPIRRDSESWRGVILAAAKEGGLTLSFLTGESPKTGYAVAERGNNREVPDTDFFDKKKGMAALMSWVRDHESKFDDPDAHLGIWYDTDNGEVVLDVSYVLQDRDEAIDRGKKNNQQAIWDIANFEEIDTGGTGDRQEKEYRNGRSIHGKAAEAGIGNDRSRDERVAGIDLGEDQGEGRQVKDVYAADRTQGTPTGTSGAVAAPFATLKPIRRRTRNRIRRIISGQTAPNSTDRDSKDDPDE